MAEKNDWWTAPTVADDGTGRPVIVTGRRDVQKFRANPRFNIRVEVTWPYECDASGMPDRATSEMMEKAHDALSATFAKDPVAVMTGVYTGAGRRDWIFYTASTHIFGRKLNEALADLPLLPLTVYAENDPDWAEYDEMSRSELEIGE